MLGWKEMLALNAESERNNDFECQTGDAALNAELKRDGSFERWTEENDDFECWTKDVALDAELKKKTYNTKY